MVTHTRNLCSAFDPSKVHTHSSEHTHAVNTQPEQWAAIYAAAPGEQLGVRCLAQGHLSRGIEGGEYIHSPHLQFLLAQDLNSQPFDYESDSLSIRPRLPPKENANNRTVCVTGHMVDRQRCARMCVFMRALSCAAHICHGPERSSIYD